MFTFTDVFAEKDATMLPANVTIYIDDENKNNCRTKALYGVSDCI